MKKSLIPNVLTCISLSLGIISIILCFQKKALLSEGLLLAAAIIHRYNGRVARRYWAPSPLGRELNSLCHLLSFGVAPSMLAWQVSLYTLGIAGFIVLLIFPICSAFKLARDNVMNIKNGYLGVPITVAGPLLVLDSIVSSIVEVHGEFTAVFMVLLSYLMLSTIKIKKV